jgi:hypothetical protein
MDLQRSLQTGAQIMNTLTNIIILEERGVDNGFAEKLADWCTVHEHSQYINLLQALQQLLFVKIKLF